MSKKISKRPQADGTALGHTSGSVAGTRPTPPSAVIEPMLLRGGHLVVVVDEDVPLAAVRASVEHAVSSGTSWMNMKVEQAQPIDAFYVGPESVRFEAQQLLALKAEQLARWTLQHVRANPDMDMLSSAGLALIDPQGRSNKVSSVLVPWPRKNPDAISSFRGILTKYKSHEATLIVYLIGCPASDWAELRSGVDSHIRIVRCEPPEGCTVSFATEIPASSMAALMGVERAMMSMKYEAGRFKRQTTPFISVDRTERRMWSMRRDGASFEAIGTKFGLNRSNVKRRLDKLPKPPGPAQKSASGGEDSPD